MSRNPYIANNVPKVQFSVCAYLDILGFKDEIKKSHLNGKSNELLLKLKKSLDKSLKYLKDKDSKEFGKPFDDWTIKTFTDNIVLGYPIKNFDKTFSDDAEWELGTIIEWLSFFQLEMSLSGFFVRGCVSVGELYIDKNIVFGNALLEAHCGESTLANFPRIVLSPSASKLIEKHVKYYTPTSGAPQNYNILIDEDGLMYLSYLDLVREMNESDMYNTIIDNHRTVIERKLSKFKSDQKIWNKYSWSANYHNYICDNYEQLSKEQIINSDFSPRDTFQLCQKIK